MAEGPVSESGLPTAGSIGFAICDPGLSFGAIVGLGAKERAREFGVSLAVESVFTPAEQASVIERFVAQPVSALIVEAVESKIVLPAIRKAAEAGIPVVIADMGIRDAPIACTVRTDNVKAAELAAAFLVEQLHGRGTIAHLQGLLTSDNGVERSRGFHNVVDHQPQIEVVFERASEWTREAGAAVMTEVLASHPDVQAVFANNDPLALGAVAAIEDAGLTGKILVVGFDALPDALLAIDRGVLAATVRQMPRRMGELSLEMAVRLMRGEVVPELVETDVALVTAETVAEASLAALPLFPRILRDLTESSAALAEERTLLRTFIDNLPDLIYVKDAAGRFVLVNRGGLRHLGADREDEILGKTDFDFYPAALALQYQADERLVFESGQPLINHEEPSTDTAGDTRWFSTTKVLARDVNGTVVGLVGMNRDITERKELEARLLQAQKMEAIGRLAGGIAHDFNNMLVVINGVADMLLKREHADAALRADIEQIRDAGERAADLTSRLLAFSHQEVIQPTVLRLNDVISNVHPMLQRLIGENVELRLKLAASVAPICADVGQLQQIIVNLALNSRDAMPEGGELVIETADVEPDAVPSANGVDYEPGRYVRMRVRDNGIGMDAATRARAFEPFFTTKAPGRGTGLGLATVFGIVQQSGGHISLESSLGAGATFDIFLPAVTTAAACDPTSRETDDGLEGRETILIVEDEPSVRKVSRRFLERYGYHVLDAANGAEALEICEGRDGPIDLIITDVVMPGMSGRELAERVDKTRPGTPVLYASGYIDSAVAGVGPADIDAPLIQKPFNAEALARKVRGALRSLERDAPHTEPSP